VVNTLFSLSVYFSVYTYCTGGGGSGIPHLKATNLLRMVRSLRIIRKNSIKYYYLKYYLKLCLVYKYYWLLIWYHLPFIDCKRCQVLKILPILKVWEYKILNGRYAISCGILSNSFLNLTNVN